ncbi:MAG: septum site-determining protein MinC [bacterium]|jgi:septum site-determining protein MinC
MIKANAVLKGTRDGLVIVLDEKADLKDIAACLEEKLSMASGFLQGAKVFIDVGQRKLTPREAKQLVKLLRDYKGLQVAGFRRGGQKVKILDGTLEDKARGEVKFDSRALQEDGKSEGVGTEEKNRKNPYKEGYTLFVRRTLRSGQRINYHGNVVVIGDVNPGAEVIAGGDILVMGVLRGMVHAGAAGNEEAIVGALRLQPTQLRIADVFTRSPDGEYKSPELPEVATLFHNKILIEPYLALGDNVRLYNREGSNEEEKEEWQWAK